MTEFEPPEAEDDFVMTPMNDLLLIMILFLLVIHCETGAVEIPHSSERATVTSQSHPLTIDVLLSGGLRLDGKDATEGDVREALKRKPELVLVRGDRRTPFEHVFQVRMLCYQEGVKRIAWEFRTS